VILKKALLFLLSFIFLVGCGYKPVSSYAKKEIHGNVYVSLHVNIDSANDSVFLKDTMNRLISGYLRGKLVSNKDIADTQVFLSLASVSHSTLTSDEDGYASKYRTSVVIGVKYFDKEDDVKAFTVSGYSDYSVANDAQVSDLRKNQAITDATDRALKKVFTKIALNNMKDQE